MDFIRQPDRAASQNVSFKNIHYRNYQPFADVAGCDLSSWRGPRRFRKSSAPVSGHGYVCADDDSTAESVKTNQVYRRSNVDVAQAINAKACSASLRTMHLLLSRKKSRCLRFSSRHQYTGSRRQHRRKITILPCKDIFARVTMA
jgi:hypothetical protein